MSVLLEVKDLHCGYESHAVIHGVSFHLNRGNFGCLLGPSGCGKTTILRAIAGFEPVASGGVYLEGESLSCPNQFIPPEKRRIGMVFQESTLFPHLTVAGNVGFGLQQEESGQILALTKEMLSIVGLTGLDNRYPHELSGGQQQRAALARALAPKPELVLLDEPFSSLDIELRQRLGEEIVEILKSLAITAVLVTHDQSEAFALADVIGVLNDGRICQWDTAYNLYHEPVDRFVADFIGEGAFVRGRLVAPDAIETELGIIKGNRAYSWPRDSIVDVLLRPDDVQPDETGELLAQVVGKAFKGAQILYSLRLETGSTVLSLFPSHDNHSLGERVGIRLAADHLVAFPV